MYNFTVTADDGVRLYLDGKLVIDQWKDQSATTYNALVTLSGSEQHTVTMEYYENEGFAVAKLSLLIIVAEYDPSWRETG